LGVKFGWVLADAGYGKGPGFLFALNDMKERFLVDVHKDFIVYKSDPRPHVPRKTATKGRHPSLAKTSATSMQVQELVGKMPLSSWQEIELRPSTQGSVTYNCLRIPVWIWDKGTHRVMACHLVSRQDPTTGEVKYSLSNASKNTTLTKLAKAQGQRYWVERSFQDSKAACGMADYQVQGWIGWHHHMALVMMGLLFMMEQRIERRTLCPNLTCKDIEILLSRMLPRKDLTVEDVLELVRKRIERRTAIYEKPG
jgi:SRSO17 transposase